ncbi:MAG: hypothetical protein A2Y64_01545 [Candidatus Coatesbacteria bacterium RBG_13_66_14]|uniref:Dicarboxylate transport domain-containing protein n=1 Tax=Candidatus Coatesbacteria bacterium RBG_13_66_14 TaxID=1817816 RepID=A0A1F5EWW9_9BACT|nr:MAG: hypothetical protein A2Y64_01545 [Candidatus Coatesbacteria bacterium RBG_13_66_14]
MDFSPFRTPRRLAVFLLLTAAGLLAAAHLTVGWLWPAQDEARELREHLRTAGVGLSWEAAGRDLALNLVLDGVEVGGLPAERLTLGADRVALEGAALGADELASLAVTACVLGKSGLSLGGTLDLGPDLCLLGVWNGVVADGRLSLAGDAVLSRRGRELEAHTSFHLIRGAICLTLESEGSLVVGRLDSGGFFFSPRLDAAELTGLWGSDPVQAGGIVCAMGWPGDNRWLVWSSGFGLRRRGAPEEFSCGPFFFEYEGGGWIAWLAGTGTARGTDGGLAELSLAADLDVRHLARSVLPLGSTGSGRVGCEVLFHRLRAPRLSLTAEGVALDLPDGTHLSLEGSMSLTDGVPRADCRFDTGGGWLDYGIGEDGVATLSGEGVTLDSAWRGGLELREVIPPLGLLDFEPLIAPANLRLELPDCRWGDSPLGRISGVVRRGAGGWTADLTLETDGGQARCAWRLDLFGFQRIRGTFRGLPLTLVRILGAEEAGLAPTDGRVEGSVELTLRGAAPDSLALNLTATGVEAPLPPFLASLWRWADTAAETPALTGAKLELAWDLRGGEPGEMALRLTSPDLRVTLSPGSRAAWAGALDISGRFEVPPGVARRMSERGVLVFRTPSGWGAVPFHLGGTWTDPQPRLDLVQSRSLAASEPPPGTVGW